MARIFLAQRCDAVNGNLEYYWDNVLHVGVAVPLAPGEYCSGYYLAAGNLVDSYCEGTTRIEVRTSWDGSGRPPRTAEEYVRKTETLNSSLCAIQNPCNLSVVEVYVAETSPNTFQATVVASASDKPLEYSLNNFTDVQDSPVFGGLTAGNYVGYVRTKI